jgi:hypothetical protein
MATLTADSVYACAMFRKPALLLVLGLSSAQASPPSIALGELTVRFDGNPIAKLHADGRTESVGDSKPGKDAAFSPGPTLHANGTIDLTNGQYRARVDGDGNIFVAGPHGPEQLFGRLAGDQLVIGAGQTGVRVDGKKLVEFTDGRDTSVIGVIDPPRMKRTALVMTAAFFIEMAITEH